MDFLQKLILNIQLWRWLFIYEFHLIIIVLSMNLVGALLVSALIVLPTLSAMRVCKSFKVIIIVSAIISVIGAIVGLIISILSGTPVGCTIVSVDIVIFIISCIISLMER